MRTPNYTKSQDGRMRATLRAEIRVDRSEHQELAALASHLGISTREVAITETTVVPRAVVEFRDGAYQITALPDYSAPVEVNGFILKRRGDANL